MKNRIWASAEVALGLWNLALLAWLLRARRAYREQQAGGVVLLRESREVVDAVFSRKELALAYADGKGLEEPPWWLEEDVPFNPPARG